MTKYKKDLPLPTEIEEPFATDEDAIFIDMSDHAGIEGEAIRVELRRTRDPAIGKVLPEQRIVDESFIIGLVSPKNLPEEGKPFEMPYHILNHLLEFGDVNSGEPISNLVVVEDCFYFSTSEGQWRLRVLDAGN